MKSPPSPPLARVRQLCASALWVGIIAAGLLDLVQGAAFTRLGSWPDTPRLEPTSVCINGNDLWVGLAAGLTVLDISQPARPVRVGQVAFADGYGAGFVYAAEDRVYTVNGLQPIHIIDAADPAHPAVLGRVTPDRFAVAVYARSNILYSIHNLNGLGLTVVSNPATAAFGGRITSIQPSGRFEVLGQRLYVPAMTGLEIRRYNSPTDLALLGSFPTGGMVRAVEVLGDYAYIAAHDGLRILDIRDPAHISQVGAFACPKAGIAIRVRGHLALLACDEATFRVIDLTDPAHPSLQGQYVAPSRVIGMDATATHAFLVVAGLNYSLDIVTFENPASPTLAARLTGGDSTVQARVAGARAYLADSAGGLQVVDVQDPARPTRLGNYTAASAVQTVDGTASRACIGTYSELVVLDTSAATPSSRGSLMVPTGVRQVRLVGDRAYVLAGSGLMSELVVVDVADPTRPTRLGSRTLASDGYDLTATASGDVAIAEASQGLEILDVRQPSSPQRVALYAASAAASGVDLQVEADGFRAFVATLHGLEIVDFRPPTAPVSRGTWVRQNANARSVRIIGSRVYLANPTTLWALQVADPAHPVLVAETTGTFNDLDAAGDTVYAASGQDGLVLWSLQTQGTPPLLWCRGCPAGVQLEWAQAGTGWTLQKSVNLLDAQGWQAVAGSTTVTTLELPCSEPLSFYRLYKP